MTVPVKLQRQYSTIHLPAYQSEGAAGFDLAAAEGYTFRPNETVLVNTGLVIQTPPDHMLMLAPRSSLFKKKGLILTNSVGIVDEDYSGPLDRIMLSLRNMWDRASYVEMNERVAQGIFVPITRGEFFEESKPQAGSRPSRGGFGSTGGYKREVWEGGRKIGEQG